MGGELGGVVVGSPRFSAHNNNGLYGLTMTDLDISVKSASAVPGFRPRLRVNVRLRCIPGDTTMPVHLSSSQVELSRKGQVIIDPEPTIRPFLPPKP